MPMHGFTDNYLKIETPYDKELINKVGKVILKSINEDSSINSVITH